MYLIIRYELSLIVLTFQGFRKYSLGIYNVTDDTIVIIMGLVLYFRRTNIFFMFKQKKNKSRVLIKFKVIIYVPLRFSDSSLYAHYVFKAFDVNCNGAISFRVSLVKLNLFLLCSIFIYLRFNKKISNSCCCRNKNMSFYCILESW